MFEQFQLSICPLRQDRSAEGFHDLLNRHGLSGKLVLGGAGLQASDHGHADAGDNGVRTTQVQRRPFQRVVDPCTYAICEYILVVACVRGLVPARDLEGRTKDLGTHEFGHDGRKRVDDTAVERQAC